MSDKKKLPAIQFYPGDWRKDPGVQALDYESRGIWFEILLLMHESESRGKLMLNGQAMPNEVLANILGIDKIIVRQVLSKFITVKLMKLDNFGVMTKIPCYVRLGKRESIPLKIRKKVLSIGICNNCKSTDNLTVDHITPNSLGGSNDTSNLQCLCWPCNRKKGPERRGYS